MRFGSGYGGFFVDEVPPLLTMVAGVRSFYYRVLRISGEFDEVRRKVSVI